MTRPHESSCQAPGGPGIETLPDLLNRTDAELMAAKRAGRNTVRG